MKRRMAAMLLLAILVSGGAFLARLYLEQRALAARMIRLHVVASSDTETDQAIKLRVRDSLLPVIGELTADCDTAAEARAALQRGLPRLRQAAQAAAEGQRVTVSLGRESFPRRLYDTFSLPAGDYESLRITLGRGEGHNWWCVAFPALCLPATQEGLEQTASASGFNRQEQELITGDGETVELKFRCLEWLRALFS